GGGDLPAAVSEAFRRLAEYFANGDADGKGREAIDIGPIKQEHERTAYWVARAMDLSGAADLLRPYKRRA
ncbi:hypothetical protein AB9K41_03445, partial [Cribrihabitans sp. XS_ASV171]